MSDENTGSKITLDGWYRWLPSDEWEDPQDVLTGDTE